MKKTILLIFLSIFFININFLFASTLHLSISSNISRINPILATDSASGEIADWIFEGLLKYDKDANIIPNLAKNYEFLDETTLIIELKENILWSDGVEFSADDVIFTYKTITSPKIFTPYSSNFRYVKDVEKIDKFKIKITYTQPYFKALEVWLTGILPKHLLKDEKNLMTSKFNQKPIGVGSYKLKSYATSKDIELISNKNYHIHKPKIDNIIYHFLPEAHTNFLMLKSQKIDIGNLSPLQLEKQLPNNFRDNFNIIEQIGRSYTYLGFNLKLDKFKDVRVREAISLAIDREELIDILFFGHGQICTGPFLPKTFAFNESIGIPKINLKRAKELLNEAGYSKDNPLEFEISTNSNNPIRLYASQIIQHQLKKVGINTKIKAMEWQAFLNTKIHARNFEVIVMGWGLSILPDAYPIWHSESDFTGGFNFIGYKNKKVDKLIKESEKIIDRGKLSFIYKDIFKLIVEDYPTLFLYIPNSITAVSKKIKPIIPSITGVMHNQIEWEIDE